MMAPRARRTIWAILFLALAWSVARLGLFFSDILYFDAVTRVEGGNLVLRESDTLSRFSLDIVVPQGWRVVRVRDDMTPAITNRSVFDMVRFRWRGLLNDPCGGEIGVVCILPGAAVFSQEPEATTIRPSVGFLPAGLYEMHIPVPARLGAGETTGVWLQGTLEEVSVILAMTESIQFFPYADN